MITRWWDWVLLLPVVGCLSCGSAPEQTPEQALRSMAAKPDEPGQSKLKVKEIETEALTLHGGSPGILHQEEVNGAVQRTPLEGLVRDWWGKIPFTMFNKRMPPRVLPAVIEGTTITLPSPAEADRILIALPDAREEVYTILVPRPPPAGAEPVAIAEAVILQVEGQAMEPHAVRVRWADGWQAAAGMQLPGWLVPLGYYRLEWSGKAWILMAQPGE